MFVLFGARKAGCLEKWLHYSGRLQCFSAMCLCFLGPGRLAVLEKWLPYTVTILDRFHCVQLLLIHGTLISLPIEIYNICEDLNVNLYLFLWPITKYAMNPLIKGTLNSELLSNENSAYCPSYTEMCTTLPLK